MLEYWNVGIMGFWIMVPWFISVNTSGKQGRVTEFIAEEFDFWGLRSRFDQGNR
jgi:hypothetical protein